MSDVFENVMELAKRRGFIWPTSECYGAVAGFIDYGPLGAMMKRRIENIWRDFYVIREGYYEIECPTIAQEAVFIASGHVAGFADKMCQCPHCKEFLRADHVAEGGGIKNASTMKNEELAAALAACKCLACEEVLGKVEVFGFNLMFKTTIGPGSQRTGYLRPETAQGMFVDFARLLRFYRDKLPFGAVQIGKSYRNEISPRQGMIRLREFTQAEAEIFVHPAEKNQHPTVQPLCGLQDAAPHLRPAAEVRGRGHPLDAGSRGQGRYRKRIPRLLRCPHPRDAGHDRDQARTAPLPPAPPR